MTARILIPFVMLLAAASASAADETAPAPMASQPEEQSELASLVAQLSTAKKMKVVLYAEHGGEVFGFTLVARPHGFSQRIRYEGDEILAMWDAFVAEFKTLPSGERPVVGQFEIFL